MNSRPFLLPFLAGVVLVALIATTGAAVVQRQRAVEAEDRVDELQAEVAELRAQVEQLEATDPLGDLLGGLLGGGLDDLGGLGDLGDLGGLLDGFLGGGGDGLLDGLLGTGGIPGAECLTAGGLDGMLDGLLGDGGDLGDLDGMLDGLLGGDNAELGGLLDDLLGEGSDLGGLLDDLLGAGELDGALAGTVHDGEVTRAVTVQASTAARAVVAAQDDPATLVDEIAEQVEQMRELAFTEDVEIEFLTSDELRSELRDIMDESIDSEALAAEQSLLAALGAVPADSDLEKINRDLLEDQVAGFYEPETGRLVVLVPDDGQVRPADRIIVAHELQHALADQAVGLFDLADDSIDRDASLAQLAVVEGDATLLMTLWSMEHLSFQDQMAMAMDPDMLAQQESIEQFPPYLQQELMFPYMAGLDFVCDAYLDGGWAGVDALYDTPPAASIGVLFPERADETPAETLPLQAPSGGDLIYDDTFGAAQLSWLFAAPGGDESLALAEAVERAGAWTGGQAQVWETSAGDVAGLTLQGGGPSPAVLCDSMIAWYEATAPDAQMTADGDGAVFESSQTSAAINCDGEAVMLAIAPDTATATAVAGS